MRSLRAALPVSVLIAALAACRDPAPTTKSSGPAESSSSATSTRFITRRASFELAQVSLTIEDVHMSTHFDDVVARTHAALVVNGGFFGDSKEPLGLAVSGGKIASPLAPQMSGGVLWIKNAVAHLTATEDYVDNTPDFAVQCRPRLVVDSRVNIKSDDGKRAARTALCLRGGGHIIDVVLALGERADDGPTLFELARELESTGCEQALNLDGGPSTGWASRLEDASVFIPPRAAVRQVVVIVPLPR